MTARRWAIVTGEYPPQPGGVSDYTRLVARGLAAAGDAVTVYSPGGEDDAPGVTVRRLPGRFGPASLSTLDRALAEHPRPDRILIQYVPHAFGWKGMNVPFAAWVAARAPRLAPVWVMFHEVAFPFRWRPISHAALGAATRVMARLVAGAAARVFVSIPPWGIQIRCLCPRGRPAEWLPVPCVVDTFASVEAVAAVRATFPADAEVVGHFGTFGELITAVLEPAACDLLRLRPNARLLLIGRNSDRFRESFAASHPDLAVRVSATGERASGDVTAHLRACDVLLQPYPDGVSSRRTSAMAALANGVPLASNLGQLSEPLWAATDAAAIAPTAASLGTTAAAVFGLRPADRAAKARRATELYRDTFSVEHTITRLRS